MAVHRPGTADHGHEDGRHRLLDQPGDVPPALPAERHLRRRDGRLRPRRAELQGRSRHLRPGGRQQEAVRTQHRAPLGSVLSGVGGHDLHPLRGPAVRAGREVPPLGRWRSLGLGDRLRHVELEGVEAHRDACLRAAQPGRRGVPEGREPLGDRQGHRGAARGLRRTASSWSRLGSTTRRSTRRGSRSPVHPLRPQVPIQAERLRT